MFHNFIITRFHGLVNSVISVLACFTMLSFSVPVYSDYYNPNTEWMRDGLYGLHFKYFNAYGRTDTTISEFNGWVDAFDVVAFAEGVERSGAAWIIWPLGRTWFNSPNATLESFVGDYTSDRDLPMDIYPELKKRGIRLMLYFACDKAKDPEDLQGKEDLGWTTNQKGLTPAYITNWSDSVKVWADRYGTKVSGYWIDHCRRNYTHENTGFYRRVPTLDVYRETLHSGNPDAVMCFNSGPSVDERAYASNDYKPGHQMLSLIGNEILEVLPPPERWWKGLLWHHIFPLSAESWGNSGTQFATQDLLAYITTVHQREAITTFSTYVSKEPNETVDGVVVPQGNLEDAQIAQLAVLKAYRDSFLPTDDCQ